MKPDERAFFYKTKHVLLNQIYINRSSTTIEYEQKTKKPLLYLKDIYWTSLNLEIS